MATKRAQWSLPSQSVRVQLLLYLAEGVAVGAAILLLLRVVFGAFLIDSETGALNPSISPLGAFFLFLIVLFLVRGIFFIDVGRQSSWDNPPEYQDWAETRRWLLVGAVALLVGGVLLGVSILLWGWWTLTFLRHTNLLLGSTIMVGLSLYLYVFHRLGVKLP